MSITRCITAACAGSVLALFSADLVEAQEGPPSLPPGLHDRALPPGKPFDGGGFDPPGQARRGAAVQDDDGALGPAAAGFAEELAAGGIRPGSTAALTAAGELVDALAGFRTEPWKALTRAVEAYNQVVLNSSGAFLQEPPDEFLELGAALARLVALTMEGAPEDAQSGSSPGGTGVHGSETNGLDLYGSDSNGSGLSASESNGSDLGGLRTRHLIEPLPQPARAQFMDRWTIPGVAASNPHGFGAGFGEAFVGASYQPRARYSDGETGAAAVGFGLGDPERYVGLQVAVSSFSTVNSGFGNRGAVDLHLHHTLPGGVGLAIGWESALSWGNRGGTRADSGENRYAVASRWISLRSDSSEPLSGAMISLGVGDGRFQSERSFVQGRSGYVGVFGGAALRVLPPVSLIAEWTGQDLLLATSITPLRSYRLAITAGVTDVTGNAGDGARFVVGTSAAYDLRRLVRR